jgi:uncharacterized protein (DUF2141 family)
MKKILFACIFVMIGVSVFSQSMSVKIRGIEKVTGNMMVALYNSSETFLKKPLLSKKIEVTCDSLMFKFDGLSAGKYALSMYQDENNNNQLDLGQMGIPTEKYGFSNNPFLFGKPDFETCMFSFDKDSTILIDLK